jgi:hypothetical protein
MAPLPYSRLDRASRGLLEGSALTALWGERGKTVYRLLETGELEVTDSVKRPDGSWAEFGRSTLKRK